MYFFCDNFTCQYILRGVEQNLWILLFIIRWRWREVWLAVEKARVLGIFGGIDTYSKMSNHQRRYWLTNKPVSQATTIIDMALQHCGLVLNDNQCLYLVCQIQIKKYVIYSNFHFVARIINFPLVKSCENGPVRKLLCVN